MLPFFSLCKSSVNLQNMHQIADRVVVERSNTPFLDNRNFHNSIVYNELLCF